MAKNNCINLQSEAFTITGAWQFNSPFGVTAPSGNVTIEATSDNLDIRANATGMRAQFEGYDVQISAHNTFAIGVDSGAGMSIDASANFSFGSGTGNFLLGAIAGTVTILANQGFSLTADNNNLVMQATLGDMSLSSGLTTTLDAPTLIFGQTTCTDIQIGNAAATMTITGDIPASPPIGSVIVMWDPVGKIFYHS